jgi:hypothetical protein
LGGFAPASRTRGPFWLLSAFEGSSKISGRKTISKRLGISSGISLLWVDGGVVGSLEGAVVAIRLSSG